MRPSTHWSISNQWSWKKLDRHANSELALSVKSCGLSFKRSFSCEYHEHTESWFDSHYILFNVAWMEFIGYIFYWVLNITSQCLVANFYKSKNSIIRYIIPCYTKNHIYDLHYYYVKHNLKTKWAIDEAHQYLSHMQNLSSHPVAFNTTTLLQIFQIPVTFTYLSWAPYLPHFHYTVNYLSIVNIVMVKLTGLFWFNGFVKLRYLCVYTSPIKYIHNNHKYSVKAHVYLNCRDWCDSKHVIQHT